MESKYILGLKSIATFFGLNTSQLAVLMRHGGVPGVRKLKRSVVNDFAGGRGVWTLDRTLAERLRHTRLKTPKYDPKRATDRLLATFEGTGCSSVDELINMGYITDLDWCNALNYEREKSYMHVPILMHPDDLRQWFLDRGVKRVTKEELYPETTKIFKPIRQRG